MPTQAVNDVLDRALIDESFRLSLQADPDGVLAEYSLTDAERRAVVSLSTTDDADGRDTQIYFSSEQQIYTAGMGPRGTLSPAELQQRAHAIKRMDGDRVAAIRELVSQLD
jgi:hypothetical protein